MKKTTIMWCFVMCCIGLTYAQTPQNNDEAELAAYNASKQSTTTSSIDVLLNKLAALEDHNGNFLDHFTAAEAEILRSYFKQQNRSSAMADFIPTAGATETFTPTVGDFFYDPGGPGGSTTGGTPGNYPNCDCDTFTTLAGVTEIDFLYYSVNNTFDYLIIYDGVDTTGPVIFDSVPGDIDDLAELMAANGGSSVFTGTSGAMTFEFHASGVVDYGGWEVEILAAGPPPAFPAPYCGPLDFPIDVEPITLVDVAGISNVTDPVVNGTPAHEDFTAISGDVEQGMSYTIALEGNTAGNFTNRFAVFIDWDQNDILDDAGEVYEITQTIVNSNGTDGQQAVGTIDVPMGALVGTTRMRVKKIFGTSNYLDPCSGASFGQAEDYSINVTAGGGGGSGPATAYAVDNSQMLFGSFDTTMPAVFNAIGPSPDPAPDFEGAGAVDIDGNAYALVNTGDFYSVDIDTGVYTLLGTLAPPAGETWVGLEFDSSTGTLYGVSGVINTGSTLSTIDIGALTATPVGATGMLGAVAFAIDGASVGYAFDIVDDQIYSIDLTTGAATALGPAGFNGNFGQGMGYDINSDTVFMTAFNATVFDSEFRSVNTTTGATTLVDQMEPAALTQYAWVGIPEVRDNDLCDDAMAVACGDVVSDDTSDGNTDSNGDGSPDEWYSYTGTGDPQIVTVSLCGSSFDTILTVYEDCTLANEIVSNDDSCGLQSEVSFYADGTSTYYIAVDGFGGASGAFDLAVTCVDPLPNDVCDTAEAISCGDTVMGTTIMATDDDNASECGTTISAPGVWYVYEDTTNLVTDINVSTCSANTDYDTKINVYTGDDCGNLICVAGNDDSPNCTNFQSEVDFQSDGNSTYYILVQGFGGATGNFELSMNCIPVPPPNDMIANSIDVDEIGFPYTDPDVAMPAATVEAGNPTGCNIDGALGVWYNFVSEGDGEVTASIVTPAGPSSVTFYYAPDENATESDLELVLQNSNQCVSGTSAMITTDPGQAYYVYVVNQGGRTDITIDGVNLGTDENTIEGFSFYPNPADTTLNLRAVDNIETVALYNILGQKVIDQTIGATSSEINIASLAAGTYVMKVTVNGETGTYKVLKK